MKKTLISLWALAVLVNSCDFVRTIAGRPTAAQVEEIRLQRIAEEEARHQARIDSMERVQQHLADSLAALETHLLDSLSQSKGTLINPSKLGGLYTTKLESKYYLIVGAFRGRSYAERKLKACNDAGFTATIISFRNGLLAVGICPSNSLAETLENRNKLRGTGVCPPETWILINE